MFQGSHRTSSGVCDLKLISKDRVSTNQGAVQIRQPVLVLSLAIGDDWLHDRGMPHDVEVDDLLLRQQTMEIELCPPIRLTERG